ncbi:MAG: hypothetical protein Q7J67_00580 [bacterium]|nr:hypothetical protein [bacterium]
MCKIISEMVLFRDCPLAENQWETAGDEVAPEQIGAIHIHRSGDWDFQFSSEGEVWMVFAAYVGGTPFNFVEFLGEI